jgi:hypothetical protein
VRKRMGYQIVGRFSKVGGLPEVPPGDLIWADRRCRKSRGGRKEDVGRWYLKNCRVRSLWRGRPGRTCFKDALRVDGDKDGIGVGVTADALRYRVATRAKTVTQRKLRGT